MVDTVGSPPDTTKNMFSCFDWVPSVFTRPGEIPAVVDDAAFNEAIREVVAVELRTLRDKYKMRLRNLEVSANNVPALPRNSTVEVLHSKILQIDHQRRRRSMEVGELRKVLKDVRSALKGASEETIPEDQPENFGLPCPEDDSEKDAAANQLLYEIREERERWRLEKRLLEQSIQEMAEDLRVQATQPNVDPEKEKLRRTVNQLQMSIESRDRFACWVCNQRAVRDEQKDAQSESDSECGRLPRQESEEIITMKKTIENMRLDLRRLKIESGDDSANGTKVQIHDVVEEEPVTPVAGTRSCRGRVMTPWSQNEDNESNQQVRFSAGDSVEERAEPAQVRFSAGVSVEESAEPAPSGTRSCRGRLVTPFASTVNFDAVDDGESRQTPPRTRFSHQPADVVEVALEHETPTLRSSRDRVATPHLSSEAVESVALAEKNSTVMNVEFVGVVATMNVPAIGTRSPRDRVATPMVTPADERQVRVVETPVAVREIEAPAAAQFRPSRDRISTPYPEEGNAPFPPATRVTFEGGGDINQQCEENAQMHTERKFVQFAEASDSVEPTSSDVKPENVRPVRERIATPFMSEEVATGIEEQRSVCFRKRVSEVLISEHGSYMGSLHGRIPSVSTISSCSGNEDGDVLQVRIADAPPDVSEVEVDSSVKMRRVRDRMVTPFMSAEVEPLTDSANVSERKVCFSQKVEDIATDLARENEESMVGSGKKMRPLRNRMTTPFAFDVEQTTEDAQPASMEREQVAAQSSRIKVKFATRDEELEAASHAPAKSARPVRGRKATGYHSADVIADNHNAPGGNLSAASADGSSVRFAVRDKEVNVESVVPQSQLRSVRGRQATGYATASDVPSESAIRFAVRDVEVEAASVISGVTRSVRDRVPTGHVQGNVDEEATLAGERASVRFAAGDQVVDAASLSPADPRSVRMRIPTGYVNDGVHDDCDETKKTRKVIFFQPSHEELPAASPLCADRPRSVRARIPTGYIHDDEEISGAAIKQNARGPDEAISSVRFDRVRSVVSAASTLGRKARPVRNRIPTGYVHEVTIDSGPAQLPAPISDQDGNQAQKRLQFDSIHSTLDAASILGRKARPVRDRIPTGYVREAALECDAASSLALSSDQDGANSSNRVKFETTHITLDAASTTCTAKARPVRSRISTGYIFEDGSSSNVRSVDSASGDVVSAQTSQENNRVTFDDQAIVIDGTNTRAPSGAVRFAASDNRSIRFAQEPTLVDAASHVVGQARSVRSRVPTGHVKGEEIFDDPSFATEAGTEAAHASKTIRIACVDSVVEAASSAAPVSRSIKARVPTGVVHADELPRDVAGGVSFAAGDCVVDVAASGDGAMRPIKSRTPTSSIKHCFSDDASGGSEGPRTCQSTDDDSTMVDDRSDEKSNGDSEASTGRLTVPPPMLVDVQLDGAPPHEERDISDTETISSCSSRNPRSRMSTPFMSSSGFGLDNPGDTPLAEPPKRKRSKGHASTPQESSATDRVFIKQASLVSSIERKITESVNLSSVGRQDRETRLSQVMATESAEHSEVPEPRKIERHASLDEIDLESRRLPGAAKDMVFLKSTLKNIIFFKDFEDSSLEELANAMQVYQFNDGEKAVKQGDTEGTHFFVVADGEFEETLDGRPISRLLPGEPFGETVLLLFGDRRSSVSAMGTAKAYGLEGMTIRDMLRVQFERQRESVVQALDEILAKDKREILSKMSGYQLQTLYEKVEMQTFAAGQVILQETQDKIEHVMLLYSGQVVERKDGADVCNVDRFQLIGHHAIAFGCQEFTVVAESHVEVLILSKVLLEDMFGDQLCDVFVREIVLDALKRHEVFSRLSVEQVDAAAMTCCLHTLRPGCEIELEDVRLLACLHGAGEGKLFSNESNVEPKAIVHFRAGEDQRPYFRFFGDVRSKQQNWKAKVSVENGFSTSVLAAWHSKDLDSILHDEDVNFALDQNYKIRVLKSVVLFRTLAMQQLLRLAERLQIQHGGPGDRIIEQGSIGTQFFILRSGQVQVIIKGEVIRGLGAGDYFGERALLSNELRTAHIDAVEDCELWVMDSETFREVMPPQCLRYLEDRIQLQDTKVKLEELQFLRVIGRGGYGVVKMVKHVRSGMRYALKCVRKKPIVEMGEQETIINERNILLEVDHPFIVKCVRSFSSPKQIYFLTELVSGGELLDILYKLGLLDKKQAQFYTGSIALALEFLHSRCIAYLDLKSENCLIDNQGYLKLIDFGVAIRIKGKGFGKRGTPMFMAPEMIRNVGFTTAADLWSLGVCLYEFILGEFPFAPLANNYRDVLENPVRFPAHFDEQPDAPETISIITGLLMKDPSQRLGYRVEGYSAIKEHPFFEGLNWDALHGREVEPPFTPQCETYAEDNDSKVISFEIPLMVEETEAKDHQDDDWSDPCPGWDASF